MPLAFQSLSHGTVAFGFFNIQTDMLLLTDLFFFATDFCKAVSELCAGATDPGMAGWRIRDPSAIGSLHAAIAGEDLSGFIGATYERWPFPDDARGFRQDPGGHQNRQEVEEIIGEFGSTERIPLSLSAGPVEGQTIALAEYVFDSAGFLALTAYVTRGGYPRWQDEAPPAYVLDMNEALKVSSVL